MAVGAASALAQKKNASAAAMGVIGNMQGILLAKIKLKTGWRVLVTRQPRKAAVKQLLG
jgi:hypothetical protein